MRLGCVWIYSERPNKHWDPEQNQEVPSPEGLTLLALARAPPRRELAQERPTLSARPPRWRRSSGVPSVTVAIPGFDSRHSR